ncbi:hypothetical protein SLEP1_g57670 [Rubroshorea leprosula]|uniref:Uncharacterized protein n=1 Tax=Rubroshorea leprosula TaxID=152421 RepID=A0AAV5MQY1_9ROSI|nr:hypothetical protein SLEP1_g57670 [Rubroshorea leprosula]
MIFPIGILLIQITLLFSNLVAGNATLPNTECVAELAAEFVACLPVIAAPPNNFSVTFSPKSSDVTTFVFTPTGNGSYCLDPLVQHPPILGFPLNVSRINLLPSVCLGDTTCSLETTTGSGS